MELEKLKYPLELDKPDFSAQQLTMLQRLGTPEQVAIATDLNIINRRLNWVIPHLLEVQHTLVEHARYVLITRYLLWTATSLVALAAFIEIILRIIRHFSGG